MWKRGAKASGMATPSGSGTSETWCSENKFLNAQETTRMKSGRVGWILPEKMSLHWKQIEAWRDACVNANRQCYKGISKTKKGSEWNPAAGPLNRELKRKLAALVKTTALLTLRKRAQAVWGNPRTNDLSLRPQAVCWINWRSHGTWRTTISGLRWTSDQWTYISVMEKSVNTPWRSALFSHSSGAFL